MCAVCLLPNQGLPAIRAKMVDLQIVFASIFLLIASTWCYHLIHSSKKRRIAPSPPGPWGLPIIGYIPFLRSDLPPQLTELSAKYGPIFQIRLGSKLWVVISSPGLFKEVVRDQDSVFANREPSTAALIATNGIDILFSPNGTYWREMRKLFVREILSNTSLEATYELRREQVTNLIRRLSSQQEKPIVIGDLIFATELEVMMSLLWGSTLVGETRQKFEYQLRQSTLKLMELLAKPNVSDFFPILARFDIQGIARQMRELVPKLLEMLDNVIQERIRMMGAGIEGKDEEDSEKKKDVLTILLNLKGRQLEDGSTFGIDQIKAVLMDMVIGGTDTTSTVVEWVMVELLDNPETMKKVQDEIIRVVGHKIDVQESHLHRLHYLDAVIKESLRLHPPASFLVRQSLIQSCVVGGYDIPKGSMVILNTWSVHRDPKFWINAGKFYPERFLEAEDIEKLDYLGNNYKYLPFGKGRRSCIGLPLAERMVLYFIATLVHSFEWKYSVGANVDRSEKFGFVTRKKSPLVAVPYQRFV